MKKKNPTMIRDSSASIRTTDERPLAGFGSSSVVLKSVYPGIVSGMCRRHEAFLKESKKNRNKPERKWEGKMDLTLLTRKSIIRVVHRNAEQTDLEKGAPTIAISFAGCNLEPRRRVILRERRREKWERKEA